MRLPGSRQRTESIRLHDRKNIARWIFEPGNRRTVPAHDPFLVRLQVTLIIMLELHTPPCQLVDRTIDIVHRKIENGESRRNVIGLWINEDIIAAGQMQSEQAMVLRRL